MRLKDMESEQYDLRTDSLPFRTVLCHRFSWNDGRRLPRNIINLTQ